MGIFSIFIFFSIALFLLLIDSAAVDTIAVSQTISDGQSIVSVGERFELGFFSPGSSKNRYLGIWYKKISPRTVVWVANREIPLTNTSGLFRIDNKGVLQVLSGDRTVIWSSNSSISIQNTSPLARLLDTGNLVVQDNHENLIWQSFDYPGDTLLPGMKFGKDLVTGIDRRLTAWKSRDDPSPGQYVMLMDTTGYPQVFERQGSVLILRLGPWNGVQFSGLPSLTTNPIYRGELVFKQEEVYFKYELVDSSRLFRMYLNPEGNLLRLNWIDQSWILYLSITIDSCSHYGQCGPYGTCKVNTFPACHCLDGFGPKRPEEWNVGDWSSGCQRKKRLDCGAGDGFQKFSGVRLPDTRRSWYNMSMTHGECEMACSRNCSCTAYANMDIRNRSGCLLWFDDLMDARDYEEAQEFYIRISASEITGLTANKSGTNRKEEIIKGVLPASVGLVLVCLTVAVYASCKKKRSSMRRHGNAEEDLNKDYTNESHIEDEELLSFSLSKVAKSTNNFSMNNKIGEGGFGAVYKGVLDKGQEIAVKRLAKTSTQGLDEFKNEVKSIAKLQHRNLVKLLGYCIQSDEIILIYEYMANKSLDSFIFDKTRCLMLDWPLRFRIIHGIARGLLYLHHDSRLRIIHRDLKAGNVLLDHDMNPKISDFGLARRFRGCEIGSKTNRVVGTYGYISPEYAVHGRFSIKSDVFSFGVLVLEIVSGKKNRGFSREEHCDNLLGHAWRLFKEDQSLQLICGSLRNSCIKPEVLRSIHVGLLCVQQNAEDRPTMLSVVLMLGNNGVLPSPKQPAFFTEGLPELNSTASPLSYGTVDEVTITVLDAR